MLPNILAKATAPMALALVCMLTQSPGCWWLLVMYEKPLMLSYAPAPARGREEREGGRRLSWR